MNQPPAQEPMPLPASEIEYRQQQQKNDSLMAGCAFGCLGSAFLALIVLAAIVFFAWWSCARY